MTTSELREEIERRLLTDPQSSLRLAREISADTGALGTDVFGAIGYLLTAGRLTHIDGNLYVQLKPRDQV